MMKAEMPRETIRSQSHEDIRADPRLGFEMSERGLGSSGVIECNSTQFRCNWDEICNPAVGCRVLKPDAGGLTPEPCVILELGWPRRKRLFILRPSAAR